MRRHRDRRPPGRRRTLLRPTANCHDLLLRTGPPCRRRRRRRGGGRGGRRGRAVWCSEGRSAAGERCATSPGAGRWPSSSWPTTPPGRTRCGCCAACWTGRRPPAPRAAVSRRWGTTTCSPWPTRSRPWWMPRARSRTRTPGCSPTPPGRTSPTPPRVSTIVGRRVPEEVLASLRARGVFRPLARSSEPVLVPADPSAHIVRTDHLWQVALGLAGVLLAVAEKARTPSDQQKRPRPESGASSEPPIGIEPMTYSLRVNRSGRLS